MIHPASQVRTLAVATVLAAAAAGAATVDLAIHPAWSGEPLVLDEARYRTAAGEAFSFTRVSCLLSGFALERETGGWVEVTGAVAWMDAQAGRQAVRLEDVPPGDYRALRFHVGPDATQNAAAADSFPAGHPLNPAVNGLHWSWLGGFIFLAMEGHCVTTGGTDSGWSYHLARDPNRTCVTVAAPLPLTGSARVDLAFDLAAVFNVPRALSFARDGSATHSREGDPIAAALVANLPGAFRLRGVSAEAPALEKAAATPAGPLYLPAAFTPYPFRMPALFPVPELPRDNPLTVERVTLGERLLRETALSRDGTISCVSCHAADRGFADAKRFSVGVEGRTGRRNAMPLANLAWKSSFFWDGRAPSLRAQALAPIQDHAEMDASLTGVVARLAAIPDYPPLFVAAFGSPEITPEKIGLALEAHVLTLTAFDSRFDRAARGRATLTDEERRGFELFMTEFEPRTGQRGADCFHCHGGALFSDFQFHNNGLDADPADRGREEVTGRAADRGKFSTPSLRNVALTAPYMHDGRVATLEEVVNHYRRGVQRSATLDPNLAKHPVGGVPLTDEDVKALVAFLETLTDIR